jgi:hypothetical protein
VERVRGKRMLVDAAGTSHVEHRHDLPVRVDFDSSRHGVRAGSVDEMRKWHDPVVVDSIRIEANGPYEIALPDPELRCSRELFVQLISRWNTGKRRNIPAGSSSRERTATLRIPERARQYAICRPPGPLPITTTSYDPAG